MWEKVQVVETWFAAGGSSPAESEGDSSPVGAEMGVAPDWIGVGWWNKQKKPGAEN